MWSRRDFFRYVAAGFASISVAYRRRTEAAPAPTAFTAEEVVLLREIGTVVLPSALTKAGQARVVDRFVEWLRGYRENVLPDGEFFQGDAAPKVKLRTPPPPYAAHRADLEKIAAAAKARFGKPFASLSATEKTAVVKSALDEAAKDVVDIPSTLPLYFSDKPTPHVVVALLAHFFRSAEGYDLLYGAVIGDRTCRGFQGTDKPPPVWAR